RGLRLEVALEKVLVTAVGVAHESPAQYSIRKDSWDSKSHRFHVLIRRPCRIPFSEERDMTRAFFLILLGSVPLLAEAQAPPPKSPRIPLERLLPHYGFGMNAMSNVKDWPETAQKEPGVNWDFLYIYI